MVDLDGNAAAAGLVDEFGRFLDRLGPIHLGSMDARGAARHIDRGAGRTQLHGDPASRCPGCTGDQRDPTLKRLCHSRLPLCLVARSYLTGTIGSVTPAETSRLPVASDSNYDACGDRQETISVVSKYGLARENCMSGDVTEVLAGFAASLQYDDLPGRVRDHCKNVLLDTLACAVAGHRGEETQQLAALAAGLAQSDESSVIGGDRLSLAGATILNGYLVTAVTMCDVHRATLTHVTPEVIPPALAIAERDGLSGRDLLVAIAAGCEVTTRVGIGLDYPAFRAKGWHGPGVLGPFGAAAAVGRLRRFDAETMARAFGLAGSQAAGTFAAWGTPTVKFHQCRGALSG